MAGRAVRETVTLAGRAERARVARAFVAAVLGPGYPSTDVAVLLVSDSLNLTFCLLVCFGWFGGLGLPGFRGRWCGWFGG